MPWRRCLPSGRWPRKKNSNGLPSNGEPRPASTVLVEVTVTTAGRIVLATSTNWRRKSATGGTFVGGGGAGGAASGADFALASPWGGAACVAAVPMQARHKARLAAVRTLF